MTIQFSNLFESPDAHVQEKKKSHAEIVLHRKYTFSSELSGMEVTPVLCYMEEMMIRVAADDKLPLLVNQKWLCEENEHYFKERLANARISI